MCAGPPFQFFFFSWPAQQLLSIRFLRHDPIALRAANSIQCLPSITTSFSSPMYHVWICKAPFTLAARVQSPCSCTKMDVVQTRQRPELKMFTSSDLVPVPGYGARVPPLELVPVPGHGAQISAQAPTKGYVQTGTGTKSVTL